jgi:predicted MFS family arabinose efflux permease
MNPQSPTTVSSAPPLGRGTLFAMALACGTAVANIYYNQPMLGAIEKSFPGSPATALVPTLTQIGYALGLLLLLPLGDIVERRRLIVMQFIAVAVASMLAALSPGVAVLVIASILLSAAATVAQQIVPFVTILAAPERRGQALGFVMSGLLTGILFSRTLAGFVAAYASWHAMFWLAAPIALLSAWLMAACLPRHAPSTRIRYGELLASIGALWRHEPILRRASVTQALLFASFTAFWTILALHLEQPPFQQGSGVAGLFGIVGAVGAVMAPLAGRMADRSGPHRVISMGAVATLGAWLVFGYWGSMVGLVAGVVLLDFGIQIALVSNQHLIYGLHPQFKSRLNAVFMTTMFLGGSLGSATAAMAWRHGGWPGVSMLGGALALLGLLSQLRAHRLHRMRAAAVEPERTQASS